MTIIRKLVLVVILIAKSFRISQVIPFVYQNIIISYDKG